MIGNLEPEENVLDYDERRPYPSKGFAIDILGKLECFYQKLGWEYGDDVVVQVGGVSVSGIDVGEEYNKKWQSPKGTVNYNKDSFIVIKNISRIPYEQSKKNE